MLNCPKCKVPLIVIERNQIELDYCTTCNGFWFDEGELQLLAESFHISVASMLTYRTADTNEKPADCPRCGKKMLKSWLGKDRQPLIDRCTKGHGVWLDKGELGQFLSQCDSASIAQGEPIVRFLSEVFTVKNKKN